ncbi:hypothetical protein IGS67_11375 [Flavimobilis sp. GY10621]|uniref:Uncharacterized protein n=1 Tax=Flavimobilis rhizosphaerae TaxID=2775421 RepID=A0ABR9DSF7_9MICO|nr:hypothetical protein [Flavimobilis rhizosphaerae]MBD9700084.1 hypothetical protein [Flavimobilis rhizosphaerae]
MSARPAGTWRLHKTFRVLVDDEGVRRTDHVLRLRRTVAVRLHYRMERVR